MTDCLDPIAPTDEELMRYTLDGEPLSDEAKKHLDSCAICKGRVTLYTETNVFLTSNLYRSQCPAAAQLGDYCASASLNLLSEEEHTHVTNHAGMCPLCSAEIAAIRYELASDSIQRNHI